MEFYNSAVNMFIRPPRAQYTAIEMGPTRMTIGTIYGGGDVRLFTPR